MIGLAAGEGIPEVVASLRRSGVPYLAGAGSAFKAIGHWASPTPRRGRRAPVQPRAGTFPLTSASLRAAGIPLAADALVKTAAGARAAAAAIGYPVVLKVISAAIPHKTEAGVVALDVHEARITEVFTTLLRNAERAAPRAGIDGVLVQKQAAPGLEMIVGAVKDPEWGWVVACGLGGIFVEVFRDTVFRRAPLDPDDAREMLAGLRAWPLLQGVRGQQPYDTDALVRLLVATSRLVEAHGDTIGGIDLNPVLIYPEGEGIVVVDHLLTAP